ncbi:MAG: carboxy-S-adenosyl-L-methionine synthase CmoA [Litorivicinaceae bacterium]
MSDLEDNLFKTPLSSAGEFRFDEKVALVFPDMIRRSVPGYGHIVGSSGLIAKRYATANTVIYDLGCSLGATTLAIAGEVKTPGCRIIAVDNSEAMLAQARTRLSEPLIDTLPIDWVCEDISDMTFEPCSVVALNFTLQFIEKGRREKLLSDVRRALYPDGALILAEKIVQEDAKSQDTLNTLHLDFKRANGYSELEIAGKRQAIENVLVPETANAHIERLTRVGFREVTEFFHCLNFKAWIAVA